MNRSVTQGEAFVWNMHGMDRKQHLSSFYDNATLLRAHAKGNALYHEIISLKQCSSVSLQRQQQALCDLAHKYLSSRGKNLLAYGRVHIEKGHLHMHLILSANELNKSNRHRLSKADFIKIQKQCEQYIQQTYPDLEQQSVYTKAHKASPEKTPQSPSSQPLESPSPAATKPPQSSKRKELDELYKYYQQVENDLGKEL